VSDSSFHISLHGATDEIFTSDEAKSGICNSNFGMDAITSKFAILFPPSHKAAKAIDQERSQNFRIN
jgi:hypothetical protein